MEYKTSLSFKWSKHCFRMDKNTADFWSSSMKVGSYESLVLNLSGYWITGDAGLTPIAAEGALSDYYPI